MTDQSKWEGKDSDFTFEQLADAIASRLRWDERAEQLRAMGVDGFEDHRSWNPFDTEAITLSGGEQS